MFFVMSLPNLSLRGMNGLPGMRLRKRVIEWQGVNVLFLKVLVGLQPTLPATKKLELRPEISWRVGCWCAGERQSNNPQSSIA